MATFFNFTGEQRVDTADLTDATNTAILGAQDDLAAVLLPAGGLSIVSGFQPSGGGTGPVTVGAAGVANVAFLGERDGAQVAYSRICVGGQSSQSVDVSQFAAGTYGIYVRLTRLPDVTQNRTFWSALDQVEQARLTQTRLVVGWELRVEAAAPSPEWLAVGTATLTAGGSGQGNAVAVVDQRTMFYSGRLLAGGVPAWGSAADRAAAGAGGLTDLATTLDALKSALVDIKGRGAAKWTDPNPIGMLVGSGFGVGAAATAERLAVGDASFYLQLFQNTPYIVFNGQSDYLQYSRSSSALNRVAAGTTRQSLFANGGALFGSGATAGYFTVAPAAGAQYGLAVRSVDAATPAALGLVSASAGQALLEMGSGGYGAAYGAIKTTWANGPNVSMLVNNSLFLSASSNTAGAPPAVALFGSALTLPAQVSLGDRPLPRAQLVWSAGVYLPGSTNSDQVNVAGQVANGVGQVPTATYVAVNGSGGTHNSVLLTFPSAFPPNASFLVAGVYDFNTGKVYQCGYRVFGSQGNQLMVGIANAADDPVNQQFTFYVYYGA